MHMANTVPHIEASAMDAGMPTDKDMELVYVLSKTVHDPSTLGIEILPGGIELWEAAELPHEAIKPRPDFPFAIVEGNLGIPQKILAKLYLRASAVPLSCNIPKEAIATTIALLLFNSGHQTALNARKRLIEAGHLDAVDEIRVFEKIARGSRECAKQSIVWGHRWWCHTHLYGTFGPTIAPNIPTLKNWATPAEIHFFPKLPLSAVRQEFDLIRHTCGTYPRNYHAWTYWHSIANVCYASSYDPEARDGQEGFLDLLLREYEDLRAWVDLHVSDYSAIHQLCQLGSLIQTLPVAGRTETAGFPCDFNASLLGLSLSLLQSYPSHESLWMYLRFVLREQEPGERSRVLEEIKTLDEVADGSYYDRLVRWLSYTPLYP